jgi:hypothetical protein
MEIAVFAGTSILQGVYGVRRSSVSVARTRRAARWCAERSARVRGASRALTRARAGGCHGIASCDLIGGHQPLRRGLFEQFQGPFRQFALCAPFDAIMEFPSVGMVSRHPRPRATPAASRYAHWLSLWICRHRAYPRYLTSALFS